MDHCRRDGFVGKSGEVSISTFVDRYLNKPYKNNHRDDELFSEAQEVILPLKPGTKSTKKPNLLLPSKLQLNSGA